MLPGGKVHSLAEPKYRFFCEERASPRSSKESNHVEKFKEEIEALMSLEIGKEPLLTFFDAENEEEAIAIFL